MNKFLFFLALVLVYAACTNPPDYPIEPVINFDGLSKNTMIQGFQNSDSTTVVLSFTDGDGDLGSSENMVNVFLIDQRDGFELPGFSIPFIPEQGAANGLSGRIFLRLFNTCCIFDDGTRPCEVSPTIATNDVIYTIQIEDRAGNRSNIVELEPITLICQ